MSSKQNAMPNLNLYDKRSIWATSAWMLLLSMFFLNANSFAQNRGEVTVIKDSRIDSIIAHRLIAVKSPLGKIGNSSGYGYRVQFFISPNRNEIYAKQAAFNEMYPDLRTYIVYQEPNYKLKAGDFRTRLEAQKLMRDIRPQFKTLFLVSEKINLPKLDPTDAKN
ncbi:MAG: hypothetical protein ACRYFL_16385 [Janthinobacterium lividum]